MNREKLIDLVMIVIILMGIIFLPVPQKLLVKANYPQTNKIYYSMNRTDFWDIAILQIFNIHLIKN